MSDTENLPGWPAGSGLIPVESVKPYLEFARLYHRHGGGDRVEPGTEPHSALSEMGVDVPSGVDLRVSVNTDETFHVVFPPDPNTMLSDEALTAVSGGNCAGSASSVGCAGTLSSIPSCAMCVSTVGTAACAGSAG